MFDFGTGKGAGLASTAKSGAKSSSPFDGTVNITNSYNVWIILAIAVLAVVLIFLILRKY